MSFLNRFRHRNANTSIIQSMRKRMARWGKRKVPNTANAPTHPKRNKALPNIIKSPNHAAAGLRTMVRQARGVQGRLKLQIERLKQRPDLDDELDNAYRNLERTRYLTNVTRRQLRDAKAGKWTPDALTLNPDNKMLSWAPGMATANVVRRYREREAKLGSPTLNKYHEVRKNNTDRARAALNDLIGARRVLNAAEVKLLKQQLRRVERKRRKILDLFDWERTLLAHKNNVYRAHKNVPKPPSTPKGPSTPNVPRNPSAPKAMSRLFKYPDLVIAQTRQMARQAQAAQGRYKLQWERLKLRPNLTKEADNAYRNFEQAKLITRAARRQLRDAEAGKWTEEALAKRTYPDGSKDLDWVNGMGTDRLFRRFTKRDAKLGSPTLNKYHEVRKNETDRARAALNDLIGARRVLDNGEFKLLKNQLRRVERKHLDTLGTLNWEKKLLAHKHDIHRVHKLTQNLKAKSQRNTVVPSSEHNTVMAKRALQNLLKGERPLEENEINLLQYQLTRAAMKKRRKQAPMELWEQVLLDEGALIRSLHDLHRGPESTGLQRGPDHDIWLVSNRNRAIQQDPDVSRAVNYWERKW